MAKIPDFTNFPNIQGIVNSVKSILNPESGTPKVEEGDPIGTKIVEISSLLQTVAKAQAQSSDNLNKINRLLDGLYQDLEAFRKSSTESSTHPDVEPKIDETIRKQTHSTLGETQGVGTTGQKEAPIETSTTTGKQENLGAVPKSKE